jgi:hypothetical protein
VFDAAPPTRPSPAPAAANPAICSTIRWESAKARKRRPKSRPRQVSHSSVLRALSADPRVRPVRVLDTVVLTCRPPRAEQHAVRHFSKLFLRNAIALYKFLHEASKISSRAKISSTPQSQRDRTPNSTTPTLWKLNVRCVRGEADQLRVCRNELCESGLCTRRMR